MESNVYQKTVDYPDEWHNGHHVMLDNVVPVTVRWEQVVRGLSPSGLSIGTAGGTLHHLH